MWPAHHDVRYPPFVSVIGGIREHSAPGEQSHAQQDTAVRRLAVAKRAFTVECKIEIKTEALKDPFQNHDGFRGTLGILRYDEEVFQGSGEKCRLIDRFPFLHSRRFSEKASTHEQDRWCLPRTPSRIGRRKGILRRL